MPWGILNRFPNYITTLPSASHSHIGVRGEKDQVSGQLVVTGILTYRKLLSDLRNV